jgi:pyridoxamine 5'-phosphate oxidase
VRGAGYTRTVPDPDRPELPGDDASLPTILAAAWTMLERGAARADDDAHWPVFASVDARDPERVSPDARVVVLRRADRSAAELEVHSDARAHKLAQLGAVPRACLVFHDRGRDVQLRVHGTVHIHVGDACARAAWDRLSASSQRAYLAPRTPGEPTDVPDVNLPDGLRTRVPDAAEAQAGFARFAVIVLAVHELDWLRLDRAGHQRAHFEWLAPAQPPSAHWRRP